MIKKAFEGFIDAKRMRDVLQQQLPSFPNGRRVITGCTIGYTKYKTYKNPSSYGKSNLSLCYHLQVTETSTQTSGEQILYLKAYLENRSRAVFEKERQKSYVTPRFGAAVAHLRELDAIVWAFPNDPVLAHLPQCIDPEKVSRHFPYEHLPESLNAPGDLQTVDVEIVHYRPEVRCTSRYTLKWGVPTKEKKVTLFGKTFADDQGKALYERALTLYQETQEQAEHFLIAKPLGYDAGLKMLWQTGLEGRALVDALDQTNYRPLLQSVATGLARFHQSALLSPIRISMKDQVAEIQKKIAKLTRAFPRLSAPLEAIEKKLREDAEHLAAFSESIIHADFSAQQLLVCKERIACFDFDEFAMGDAAQDVANFIVDCYFRDFDPEFVPLITAAFVQAYEAASGAAIPGDRLNWYVRLLFITKAYRFYLQQRPQLEAEVSAIVALACQGIGVNKEVLR
ncbi:MAG: aminoglycoside phosphotransferase family protein [Nitrospiria bacterium]